MSIIFHTDISDWRDLQNKSCQILSECGMEADTEVDIKLVRGGAEIDVVANDIKQTPPTKIFVECKHWAKNVNQEKAHAFRAIVQDAGANIGFIISSSGFQSGAYDVVQATNIKLMTWTEFQEYFFTRWFESMTKTAGKIVEPICEYFDYFGKITRGLNGTKERVEKAEKLQGKYRVFHNASQFLNMEINGEFRTFLRFPMKGIDPRGDINQLDKITIENPREYFDLILSEHENALRAFEQFTSELKEG